MSCGCNKTNLQGTQYCQECMPSEFHWLVPVSKEPDPFLMDRNHAYIDPNNVIYILSRDRLRAIKLTTSEGNIDLSPYALKEELASKISELVTKLTEGLEGAKYFEGEGIRIDEDNRIHSTVNLTEVNRRLDSLELVDNSPYKAGTGIEITPDLTINSTVDVSELESRVQDLEEQEDKDTKYTAGAGLQLNGTEFSVDYNDLPSSEGSFVGYAKLSKELTDVQTSFIFNEIPTDSVIFLSIFYERDGFHHVFTRNWWAYQADYLQAIIEYENVNINYNGVDTLTVAFDNQTLGFATVDVVSIRKEGLTNTRARVSTE